MNDQCGLWMYLFAVYDTNGADVTAEMSDVFKYTALADNYYFEIDNSAGTLLANDVYVVGLAGMYINPLTGAPSSPAFNTQIPIIVMEKFKLIDTSIYGVMVDQYLEMADPYIQEYFFNGAAIIFTFVGVMFPALMSFGQAVMFFLVPPAWWGMAVFNMPISVGLISYWLTLLIGGGNLLTTVEAAEADMEPVE